MIFKPVATLIGKTMATLTHHKKTVRALAPHPTEYVTVVCTLYYIISHIILP